MSERPSRAVWTNTDCPVSVEVNDPDTVTLNGGTGAQLTISEAHLPADALLSIHTDQCRHRDEQTLNRHLRTHRLDEWVTALMTARGQVVQIGRIMLDQATEFARFAKLDGKATS